LIAQLGFDAVITLTFDRALSALTAEAFMQQMSAALGLRRLWVGSDFALGRNRQGDLPTLRALGEKLGYALSVVPDVRSADGSAERISSSLIREALRQGRASAAARMLGRPYAIEGPVMHGDRRGRTLGFPTANIGYWPGKIIPAYGVYATWTWVGGQRYPSVTSVGVRPTFHQDQSAPLVEAFLIDFDRDIYDQQARVEFLEFLRPELRFDSAQSLINQMVLDTQNAKEVLAHAA
jgi:riboflavin kinase/FMN adenylyltransferase